MTLKLLVLIPWQLQRKVEKNHTLVQQLGRACIGEPISENVIRSHLYTRLTKVTVEELEMLTSR